MHAQIELTNLVCGDGTTRPFRDTAPGYSLASCWTAFFTIIQCFRAENRHASIRVYPVRREHDSTHPFLTG